MLVLDTDVSSILQTGHTQESECLEERIRLSGESDVVTIVTFQEQIKGRLAQCAKANDPEQYVIAARKLHQTLNLYRKLRVIDFTDTAATEFRRLKAQKIRIGTMDLRIAAIVLVNNARLISKNLADFRKVPNLRVEDWTRPA